MSLVLGWVISLETIYILEEKGEFQALISTTASMVKEDGKHQQ